MQADVLRRAMIPRLGELPAGVNYDARLIDPRILPRLGDDGDFLTEVKRAILTKTLEQLYLLGESYDSGAEVTVTSGGGLTEIVGFTLPTACIGIWQFWGQNTAVPADFVSLTWQLVIDNVPILNRHSIVGQISTLVIPAPVYKAIPAGARVAVRASQTSGASIASVGARIGGVYWPQGTFR